MRSGVEQTIEVKPKYGLTGEKIEKMLFDSGTYAKEDMQVRSLVEARTDSEQLIVTTYSFIKKNRSLLTEEELTNTQNAITGLDAVMNSPAKDIIQTKIEELNEFLRPYAKIVMEIAVANSMSGKTISDKLGWLFCFKSILYAVSS